MINKTQHIPVLLDEVINALSLKDDEFYIDATFGLGGYTKAILDKKNCKVLSIDRDPETLAQAERIKEKYKNRFLFQNGKFSQIENFLEHLKIIKRY